LQSKRDPAWEAKLLAWISEVTGEPLADENDIQISLKSGVLLCK